MVLLFWSIACSRSLSFKILILSSIPTFQTVHACFLSHRLSEQKWMWSCTHSLGGCNVLQCLAHDESSIVGQEVIWTKDQTAVLNGDLMQVNGVQLVIGSVEPADSGLYAWFRQSLLGNYSAYFVVSVMGMSVWELWKDELCSAFEIVFSTWWSASSWPFVILFLYFIVIIIVYLSNIQRFVFIF